MTVSVLLVSHDGARWLPAVLDGLERQTLHPARIVAVDTGSGDASPEILTRRLGADALVPAPADSSFGTAVRAGLAALDRTPGPPSPWIWLLHDDSAPAPEALERLVAAARSTPSAAVLGPKLREWPSLRRLLEVGVTLTGTGTRETGLERGEYDQGQHDRPKDVLAVNTAGMLVRRDVLDELGFDERLPVFGNDVDFGWRAARAGHRTVVVPDAVVFHVEAAHRGVRRTAVTSARPRRAERRAALYTLLVNCAAAVLPFQVLRLFLGSLLRAGGLVAVRAPGEAADELVALLMTYLRPDRIISGRRARRRTARAPRSAVRPLLAPAWMPYRHGLDVVSDLVGAVARQAGDASAARGRRAIETGPAPAEAENLPADAGLVVRLLGNPVAMTFAALAVLALVGSRGLLGSGMLSGGGLLPAPEGATGWWRMYLQSWHEVGVGSARPAAPYLLPLAALGTAVLGKAWLVVDLMFLFVVPLAALGAYRFLRLVTGSRASSLWGAVTYGLLPVMGGAVQQGRLGTVALALVLPWLAHSAWFLWPGCATDRRWRAAWRTSLWLALAAAFTPVLWLLGCLVGVAAAGLALGRRRSVAVIAPLLTPVLVAPLLLLPWSLQGWRRGAESWLFEAGLPAAHLLTPLDRWALVLGRPVDGSSAPGWLSAGLVLAAVVALLRRDTRARVLVPWTVIVLGLALTAALSTVQPVWLGAPLLVVHGAAVCAAAVAGTGVWTRLAGTTFGWRQPVGLVVVAGAVLTPLTGLVWWAAAGSGGEIDRRPPTEVPTYITDAALADPDHGVLVIRGSHDAGFEYTLLRDAGRRLGSESLDPGPEVQQPMTDLVTDLVTSPGTEDIAGVADRAVQFIYAPAPADSRLVGNLDSVSGLTSASAVAPGARAWQVEADASGRALPVPEGSARPWLLLLQGLALVGVSILAGPTRRTPR